MMKPVLIPLLERAVRKSLRKHGVSHRFVATSAGTIHVYDIPGNGTLPTVVFLHGISASGTSFAPLFMRLAPHVKRIIVPDYPDHGFSGPPTVKLTLEALFDSVMGALDDLVGDQPHIVIGNSLGGAVALDYAAKREAKKPGSIQAVVLLSPAGAQSTKEEWTELMGLFSMKNRRDGLVFMSRVYHRLPFIMTLLAHELPSQVRRRGVAELFASVSHESQASADEVSKLTMPILFIWGQSERLLPDSHLGWWKKHLPKQAVIEQPAGMGHCPHVDAPGPLSQRIVAFLRENVTMPS